MAKEAFYFSHDYNARNDEKILTLRSEFGAEGYGVYWMLIESMAENSDCAVDIRLIAGLSVSYGIAKDKLAKIIDFCLSIKLLETEDGKLYSKRLNDHKDFRKGRSEAGKIGAEKKWITVREKKQQFKEMAAFFNNTCVRCEGASELINIERDHIVPTYQGGVDNVTNWQPLCAKCNASKGPENIDWRPIYAEKHGLAIPELWLSYSSAIVELLQRKGKERKVNNTPLPPEGGGVPEPEEWQKDFEWFWDVYDKKVDRSKCERKFKNLSKAEREQLHLHVPEYVASTPDAQYRKNPLTYLNGKCWNDEIRRTAGAHNKMVY